MGFFQKIFSSSSKTESSEWPYYNPNDRKNIPAEILNKAQKTPASERYSKRIYRIYYHSYKEKPFISKDRELYTNWLREMKSAMPHKLVSKEMMIRFADGLLPGDVFLLDYLASKKATKIPSYFEYKYGINYWAEKDMLAQNDYLCDDGLTEKGKSTLALHSDILSPKIKKTLPDTIQTKAGISNRGDLLFGELFYSGDEFKHVKGNYYKLTKQSINFLQQDFQLINDLVKMASQTVTLNFIPKITATDLDLDCNIRNGSFVIHCPTTKTGRLAKYPYVIRIMYKPNANSLEDVIGTLEYLENKSLGKADITFWKTEKSSCNEAYTISFRRNKDTIYISKILHHGFVSGEPIDSVIFNT